MIPGIPQTGKDHSSMPNFEIKYPTQYPRSLFGILFIVVIFLVGSCDELTHILQGFYSLNEKTSNRQISWSLEAARLDVIMIVSL